MLCMRVCICTFVLIYSFVRSLFSFFVDWRQWVFNSCRWKLLTQLLLFLYFWFPIFSRIALFILAMDQWIREVEHMNIKWINDRQPTFELTWWMVLIHRRSQNESPNYNNNSFELNKILIERRRHKSRSPSLGECYEFHNKL